jgi:hypothetical protein
VSVRVPKDWHLPAAVFWAQGRKREAIQSCFEQANRTGGFKDPARTLQCSYYLFLSGDYRVASEILRVQARETHDHHDVQLNLGVCLSRLGEVEAAAAVYVAMAARHPDSPAVWDGLASALYRLNRVDEARDAGSRALRLKDARACAAPIVHPPDHPAAAEAERSSKRVIAFSLWGDAPRFLRGALHNALAIPEAYPGWTGRFYVDASVPAPVIEALAGMGCEVVMKAEGQSLLQKLAWRFEVCNERGLSRFLVRDADSVVGAREARAVGEWERSGRRFHVMRDWWTHTDLVLAGMWGGVPGHLPEIRAALDAYRSPHAETPSIDQWFLRDRIWPHMRGSCLIHDRLFTLLDSRPFPGETPQGNRHVGQDEFAVRRGEQEALLAAWIRQLPCLSAGAG